jgi:hypothetical protein
MAPGFEKSEPEPRAMTSQASGLACGLKAMAWLGLASGLQAKPAEHYWTLSEFLPPHIKAFVSNYYPGERRDIPLFKPSIKFPLDLSRYRKSHPSGITVTKVRRSVLLNLMSSHDAYDFDLVASS